MDQAILFRFSLSLVLSVCLSLIAAAPANAQATLELIYSADLDGELEPCGCTAEGDLGGLRRQATLIARLREQHPDLILLSAGGLFAATGATHQITNRFILEGLRRLDYDAIGLQWADLLYGTDFLAPVDLPWVASNWRSEAFPASLRIRRPAAELVVFQWLDPGDSPYRAMPGAAQPTHADVAGLHQALAQARQSGALTLLATTLEPDRAAAELPLQDVDILIARSLYEQYAEPRRIGSTLLLQAGSRGQRLGRLRLTLGSDGRIADWDQQVMALPASVPDSPALASWYADYSAALMRDYSERIVGRAGSAPAARVFAGTEACAACHQAAHRVWSDSAHASAWAALENANKTFDANCIGCHVLGFGRAGGFVDPASTPGLSNVQCESCHGPALAHVENPAQLPAPIDADACRACHNRAHSPGFDFAVYWPRIAHGGAAQ